MRCERLWAQRELRVREWRYVERAAAQRVEEKGSHLWDAAQSIERPALRSFVEPRSLRVSRVRETVGQDGARVRV